MLDQMSPAWHEQEPPRPRRPSNSKQARARREARRRRERQRRIKSAVFMTFFAVFLLGLGYGVYMGVGWVQEEFGPRDWATEDRSSTTVVVRIPPGADGYTMARAMVDAGVVRTFQGFVDAFDANNGSAIQPGAWMLYKKMPSEEVVRALLNREGCTATPVPPCRVFHKVTIPEGMVTVNIYRRLSEATGVPVADFTEAAKDPVKLGVDESWFAPRPSGTEVMRSVEGFLFPATYEFDGGMSAEDMLKQMVQTFNDVTSDLKFVETANQMAAANNIQITPYEVLIAASIIEAEAVFEEDFPKVARVLYNRGFVPNLGPCGEPRNCLGLDSTINYWLRVTGAVPIDSSEITVQQINDPNNPYNTYRKGGMPPGAISNPGRKSMLAALTPAPPNNDKFFISIDKEGHMAYAANDSQHCANLRTANRNGLNLILPSGC